ncbi:MFS transporter [Komagataeibacter europaeus]|uniref:MFS transporter n=1 Tax=Komagataeibacter europaeus TaxID=33995 RepID=UPI000B3EB1DD|nr:MFS transporter [Komagataeibacter europaeus]ARW15924.1 Hexuronate transporter [Komagataeibacter europaeus]
MTSVTGSRIHSRRRGCVVALLMVAGAISYIDRSALSVGNTTIAADMHFSDTQMGWMLSAFAWAYLVCQVPAGLVSDRWGGRIVLGISLIIWSLAQIAFGLVSSLWAFFACRAFLGAGEAPLFLAGTGVITRWYRAEERGRPIGLFNASATLGPAMAPPLLLLIMSMWGWRGMSVAVGCVSLVLAFVWLTVYRDPAQAMAARHRSDVRRPFPMQLLRQRSTWVMTGGFVGIVYITWLYGAWLPAYLQKAHHLTLRQASLLSALPQMFGFVGSITGGFLTDWLGRRGVSPVVACRTPLVWGLVCASIMTVLTGLVPFLGLSIALICIALFAGGIAMTCGWALGAVVVTEDCVATMESIQNTGGSLGGALAPALTGMIADHFRSFVPSLLVAGVIGLLCAGIYRYGLNE